MIPDPVAQPRGPAPCRALLHGGRPIPGGPRQNVPMPDFADLLAASVGHAENSDGHADLSSAAMNLPAEPDDAPASTAPKPIDGLLPLIEAAANQASVSMALCHPPVAQAALPARAGTTDTPAAAVPAEPLIPPAADPVPALALSQGEPLSLTTAPFTSSGFPIADVSPAPAPVPGAAAPVLASAHPPSPAMAGEAGAVSQSLDAAIERAANWREAARAARPEVLLRHGEFGMVSLRIEAVAAVAGEWRALLTSRDPGFVPAVQAALAERAVAASSESGLQSGAGSGSGSGSARSGEGAGGHPFGSTHYGSSPGSGQGSSQPYFGHIRQQGHGAALSADEPSDTGSDAVGSGGGLFA